MADLQYSLTSPAIFWMKEAYQTLSWHLKQDLTDEEKGIFQKMGETLSTALQGAWWATYQHDKAFLQKSLDDLLNLLDALDEAMGPDTSLLRTQLQSAKAEVQGWIPIPVA